MRNTSEKDKWIEEVINSAGNINRISGDARLYEKMRAGLENNAVPTRSLWPRISLAASLLLVILNTAIVIYNNLPPQPNKSSAGVYETMKAELNILTNDNSVTYAGK